MKFVVVVVVAGKGWVVFFIIIICIGVFYLGLIMSDIMRLSCRLLLVCNFLMSFIDFVNKYLNNLLVTW